MTQVTGHQDSRVRTLCDLLERGVDQQSALEAFGETPLSFKALRSLVDTTVARS